MLRSGEENPLEHGSGLGRWLLHWGASRFGGAVSFHRSAAGGTTVRFPLPAVRGFSEAPTAAAASATPADE